MKTKKYVEVIARDEKDKKKAKEIEKLMNWVYRNPKVLYSVMAMLNPDIMSVDIDGISYGGKK